jgi:NADPH2:quinone reductase
MEERGPGSIGSFVIKLTQASNIHPIIAGVGASRDYVETIINREKTDSIVDDRLGPDGVLEGIKQALSAARIERVEYAFDAVLGHGNNNIASRVLAPDDQVAQVLPFGDLSGIRKDIKSSQSAVATVFGEEEGVEIGDGYSWYVAKTGLQSTRLQLESCTSLFEVE